MVKIRSRQIILWSGRKTKQTHLFSGFWFLQGVGRLRAFLLGAGDRWPGDVPVGESSGEVALEVLTSHDGLDWPAILSELIIAHALGEYAGHVECWWITRWKSLFVGSLFGSLRTRRRTSGRGKSDLHTDWRQRGIRCRGVGEKRCVALYRGSRSRILSTVRKYTRV